MHDLYIPGISQPTGLCGLGQGDHDVSDVCKIYPWGTIDGYICELGSTDNDFFYRLQPDCDAVCMRVYVHHLLKSLLCLRNLARQAYSGNSRASKASRRRHQVPKKVSCNNGIHGVSTAIKCPLSVVWYF